MDNTCINSYFFEVLGEWQRSIEDVLKWRQDLLTIVLTKPAGAVHNPSLHTSEDGKVWKLFGSAVYEVQRNSDLPYAEYIQVGKEFKRDIWLDEFEGRWCKSVQRPDGTKLVFVEYSHMTRFVEDWCWEVKSGSYSTASYIKDEIRSNERGFEFARLLFEQRAQVESWFHSFAIEQGEARADNDQKVFRGDWKALLRQFAPRFVDSTMPDNGHLLCVLHALLDQIALGRQIQRYAF